MVSIDEGCFNKANGAQPPGQNRLLQCFQPCLRSIDSRVCVCVCVCVTLQKDTVHTTIISYQ